MNNKLRKNFIWNTLGTLTFSITSLIYTMIMSRYCNLFDTGIFTFAFSFACMMVTLASFGGRTYQVTDTKNEIKTSSYIITRYITVLFSFVLIIVFLLLNDYNFKKNIIIILLCFFKFLEEISDVYYGIIHKNNKLYKVGQYQFIKSIINVLLFIIGIIFINNFIYSILFITINNLLFLLIERKKAKKIHKWKIIFNKKEIIKLLKINFFICGYNFFSAYLVNASKYSIDSHLSDDVQAIFNMLIMPATLVMLIGTFIINPIIVNISKLYNDNKIKEIKKVFIKLSLILFILGIVVLGGTYLLGTKVLEVIYNIDFSKYRFELCLVILGAIFYTFTTISGTILIALRKIKSQFYLSILCCVFAYFVSNYLVIKYFINGGIYAYLIIMIFRTICYIILLTKIFKFKNK